MDPRRAAILTVLSAVLLGSWPQRGWSQDALPPGFVRLADVAPAIAQDIRYARTFNFTGAPVPGYEAPSCVLWRPAANALAKAQARLETQGYRLKVYDCYRPVRAVRAFAAWSGSAGGDAMKPVFYPAFDKSRLFALGFIATKSKHSTGTTVDIGMVRADEDPKVPTQGGACDGPFASRAVESSLDFGTSYDCFSALSATASPRISDVARANRKILRDALAAAGFRNYAQEWWHFELADRSAPTRVWDFPIR